MSSPAIELAEKSWLAITKPQPQAASVAVRGGRGEETLSGPQERPPQDAVLTQVRYHGKCSYDLCDDAAVHLPLCTWWARTHHRCRFPRRATVVVQTAIQAMKGGQYRRDHPQIGESGTSVARGAEKVCLRTIDTSIRDNQIGF